MSSISEALEKMLKAALEIKLYANLIGSRNPARAAALERIRSLIEDIIDDIEELQEGEAA